jgi:hypothetical protein
MSYPEYDPKRVYSATLDPESSWRDLRGAVVPFLTAIEWEAVRLAWETVGMHHAYPEYTKTQGDFPIESVYEGANALQRLARLSGG